MHALALIVLLAGELRFSGYAQQSRSLFEKVLDVKLEKNLIVLKADPKSGVVGRSMFQLAQSTFTGIGRVYVRYQGGGSSTSRGGTGSVTIRHELDGGGAFEFDLQSPDGKETLSVKQPSPGQLTILYRQGRRTISYTQSQGKCQLKVRTGMDAMAATRSNFTAIFQDNPEVVQRNFIALLEAYFDDLPDLGFSPAPPGKVILHLRDGTQIVGELKLETATLHTDYGNLDLPRDEIRHIVFGGSDAAVDAGGAVGKKIAVGEAVVVMKKFAPRGRLEVEEFQVATQYGTLTVDAGEVLHALFGPPLEDSGGDADAPEEAPEG